MGRGQCSAVPLLSQDNRLLMSCQILHQLFRQPDWVATMCGPQRKWWVMSAPKNLYYSVPSRAISPYQ
jgi:hypothetical protein